tara:strand:+ start:590 stop:2428 length:1839 start_codon:yes stop_codon:yes gene_type:complete
MKNKNIIIFSSIDWNMHKQLHHQLTYSLLENKNRILFIENSGVRRVKFTDLSRLFQRLKDWSKSVGGYQENIINLTILVSLIFPFPYSKFFTIINKFIIVNKVKKWLRLSQISKPIIITFLPTPLVHKLLQDLEYEFLIYYCANNMSKGSKESLPLKYWEELMFKNSDVVLTISNNITERAKLFNSNVKEISPGVDEIFFKRNDEKKLTDIINISNPIVGYVGSISDVIDFDLIEYLVKNLKGFSFVFLGPIYTKKIFKFKKYKNVYFIGGKLHTFVPDYIRKFNVTIIPYLVNDFTDSVYSCKLNEYLSCGKPVISSGIKENINFNENYPNSIFISKSKEDFKNNIITALKQDNKDLITHRQKTAKLNSWNTRFLNLNNYINEKILQKEINKQYIDKFSFISLYKRSRNFINKSIIILFTIYILIFYSPIFWLLGNNLNTHQSIENSDSIVVFSGNDKKYSDQDYLDLVLRAKKLYDQNRSDKIILLSGKGQSIKEVDIMKLYLENRGVPNNQIHVFENYPSSTFMGIIMINQLLNKENMNKIIYISSEYHNLRSKLIWDKNFPDKKIMFLKPEVKKNNNKFNFWFSSYSDIKIILYEYASIVYNKYLGRL